MGDTPARSFGFRRDALNEHQNAAERLIAASGADACSGERYHARLPGASVLLTALRLFVARSCRAQAESRCKQTMALLFVRSKKS
jgi:hypothetical protein